MTKKEFDKLKSALDSALGAGDISEEMHAQKLAIIEAKYQAAQKPAGKPPKKEAEDHLEASLAKGYITQEEYNEAKKGTPNASKIEVKAGKTFSQIKNDLDAERELGYLTEEEYTQKLSEAKGEKPNVTQSPKANSQEKPNSPLDKKYADCLAQLQAYKAEKDEAERIALASQARAKGEKVSNEQAKEMPKTELRQKAGQATNTITPREGKEKAIENLVKWELKSNQGIKKEADKLAGEDKKTFIEKRDQLIEEAKNEIKKATQKILDELETKLKKILSE